MRGMIYLVWRYLAYHRWKSSTLIAAITLVLFLPAAMQVLIDQTSQQLKLRAAHTPFLIGARGSPLELVLNSLYLQAEPPAPLSYQEVSRIRKEGLARAIPLYVRFQAQGAAIVGTSLAYFDYRHLAVAKGRQLAVLGDAVVGANVARRLGLQVGDAVISSPQSAFDLAGVYPLKMPVVGILAANNSPDDDAIFVDVKTAWIIAGIGHGHQDLTESSAAAQVLTRQLLTEAGKLVANNVVANKVVANQVIDNIVANASVLEFNEITAANRDSFHFHGSIDNHPLTAIIPLPHHDKAAVILQGRYQTRTDNIQMVRPPQIMDELMQTIFTVRQYVLAAMMVLGVSTALVVIFVFLLSLRLRQGEMQTLMRIGGGRGFMVAMAAAEMLVVVVVSVVLAVVLTWLVEQWGGQLMQEWLVG